MATVRCEVSQQVHAADVPADYCMNVVHYTGGTDYDEIAAAVLGAFNGTAADADGDTFDIYSSSAKIFVNVYDLADDKPRPLKAYASSTGEGRQCMPLLLASCLSFYGTRNLASQRGRIYIGPFTAASVSATEAVDPTILAQGIVLAKLLSQANATDWDHVVWSVKNQTAVPVTDYWMDNAWDVMHSREEAATTRSSWAPGA